MSALTKEDLVQTVHETIEGAKSDSKEFVESFIEEIKDAIIEEGEVKLSGFGNFVTRKKDARPGRNPKTGEAKEVSARRVVTFKPGDKLGYIVNGDSSN